MIQKQDFIEIDYVARLKETSQIVDLTKESVAKTEKIHRPDFPYHPIIICVGENQVVKGLDEFLIEKELKTYKVDVKAEKAFGLKDPKLMKIVSLAIFQKQNIKPFPGLQLNIDGMLGIVKTVSGGRVVLDFNHPLAGKDLAYEVTVNRVITDDKEKLKGFLETVLNKKINIELKDGIAKLDYIPEALQPLILKKIKELIPSIKELEFGKPPSKNN